MLHILFIIFYFLHLLLFSVVPNEKKEKRKRKIENEIRETDSLLDCCRVILPFKLARRTNEQNYT